MCGIAGWTERDCRMLDRSETLKAISETLERRGPDENGTYINGDLALMHRRLVVIDRENGKQPLSARHGDATYVIVYNGELYNSAELREELRADGFHFRGHSDTEVVLKTYIKYGARCGERLNGIFAFAVFNTKDRSLFLCRDKIGVKPLFYSLYEGGLVFGSEIKALLASGRVKPQVDRQGLYELFFLGPARTPGCGVFKDVNELLPGECALYKGGRLTRKTYFSPEAREHTESETETLEHTRALLTDAIERQLVSDVPLCMLLSGGLDSSVIVKVASLYNRARQAQHLLGGVPRQRQIFHQKRVSAEPRRGIH